ncbi:hypothetical protein COO60DRAFT_1487329 [Scenedesmus sp. NREL 46B-D3]|nr:hypothetical protein COO60DRAFT_1487329 [Scenedesmus sp. NREL 46B-D3]
MFVIFVMLVACRNACGVLLSIGHSIVVSGASFLLCGSFFQGSLLSVELSEATGRLTLGIHTIACAFIWLLNAWCCWRLVLLLQCILMLMCFCAALHTLVCTQAAEIRGAVRNEVWSSELACSSKGASKRINRVACLLSVLCTVSCSWLW